MYILYIRNICKVLDQFKPALWHCEWGFGVAGGYCKRDSKAQSCATLGSSTACDTDKSWPGVDCSGGRVGHCRAARLLRESLLATSAAAWRVSPCSLLHSKLVGNTKEALFLTTLIWDWHLFFSKYCKLWQVIGKKWSLTDSERSFLHCVALFKGVRQLHI